VRRNPCPEAKVFALEFPWHQQRFLRKIYLAPRNKLQEVNCLHYVRIRRVRQKHELLHDNPGFGGEGIPAKLLKILIKKPLGETMRS